MKKKSTYLNLSMKHLENLYKQKSPLCWEAFLSFLLLLFFTFYVLLIKLNNSSFEENSNSCQSFIFNLYICFQYSCICNQVISSNMSALKCGKSNVFILSSCDALSRAFFHWLFKSFSFSVTLKNHQVVLYV